MSTIDLDLRLFIYNKTLNSIGNYFAHWEDSRYPNIDELYPLYIDRVINTKDRYQFGLLMKEVIANLKNGHSGYWDGWFNKKYAYSMGFYAFYHDTNILIVSHLCIP